MLQVLFHLPFIDLPVYSYGLMMVIGFIGAMLLAKFVARRSGLDPELFVNAALIALVAGVGGARLSHVLENLHQYIDPSRSVLENFKDAINIRSGGLTYYGGFLLAFPSLLIYARIKKIPLRLGMDIIAPCLVIGLGFGRIGCFLNGCCYGDRCDLPWAVQFPYQSFAYEEEVVRGQLQPPQELLVPTVDGGEHLITRDELAAGRLAETSAAGLPIPVPSNARALAAGQRSEPLHPAQLYSSFTAFLIAAICFCYFTLPHAPGTGFSLMLMLEGSSRFILELLRVEPSLPGMGPFSLSMLIGLIIAVLGLALWIVFKVLDKRQPQASAAFA